MPIRVLQVVTYMGRGGLETMLMNYYRNIDRNKVQFDFLVHRDFEADYDKEIRELGGRIYHMPRLNPFNPVYYKTLDMFFKNHPEYKIVHSHLDCMAGIPLKVAKKNHVPCRFAHAHNSDQQKDKKYLFKLFFKRNIKKNANYLFACGEEAGIWMFHTQKFSILKNAIDSEKYKYNEKTREEYRKKLGIGKETLVVGHVGRFVPQKNHDFIIDVFCDLLRKRSDSKLVLVGAGELQDQIREKVKTYGIEKEVLFTGVRSDIAELLQVMDVFLFPSLFEGLGIANIEAQAAGLPCLISDKVPSECEKTVGLVHQLKLSHHKSKWIDVIIKMSDIERTDRTEEIKRSGFDIIDNSNKLEQFYLRMYKKYGEN